MREHIVRGHLDMLVLSVLEESPAHGWAVVEELKRRSGGAFDLPEGTVYPALYRLEEAGLLTSEWRSGDGRRRRVYRITARGRRALVEKHDEWTRFAGAIASVMRRGKAWPART